MSSVSAPRAIVGGFIGTLVMAVILYFASLVELPTYDMAALLAVLLTPSQVQPYEFVWWLGMLMYFAIGSLILPTFYCHLFFPAYKQEYTVEFTGSPIAKGLVWGFFLWLGSMLVFFPLFGEGIFLSRTDTPFELSTIFLIADLLYGGISGSIARPRLTKIPAEQERDIRGAA